MTEAGMHWRGVSDHHNPLMANETILLENGLHPRNAVPALEVLFHLPRYVRKTTCCSRRSSRFQSLIQQLCEHLLLAGGEIQILEQSALEQLEEQKVVLAVHQLMLEVFLRQPLHESPEHARCAFVVSATPVDE